MLNARCSKKRHAVLAVGMIFLTGCATGSSEQGARTYCPPVVEYSREEQRRVADEVEALPEDAVIISWLADYTVLRAQLDYCR